MAIQISFERTSTDSPSGLVEKTVVLAPRAFNPAIVLVPKSKLFGRPWGDEGTFAWFSEQRFSSERSVGIS
jgi:hypothetical protein